MPVNAISDSEITNVTIVFESASKAPLIQLGPFLFHNLTEGEHGGGHGGGGGGVVHVAAAVASTTQDEVGRKYERDGTDEVNLIKPRVRGPMSMEIAAREN
ncbi:hypothetical protein RUM44_000665 [Polyplax serrata]|uniref:Uncharacterized protein n=1 Tax=Polyplax serrata TaxID=468196 RepID=A0ABR1B635_POLSC